jgi:hypothetical protein
LASGFYLDFVASSAMMALLRMTDNLRPVKGFWELGAVPEQRRDGF